MSIEDVWRDDRGYVLGLASRMLGDTAAAEDVVQEAFSRLSRIELAEIDDVRGWLAVVVRRLCLDRLKSAHVRRETAAVAGFPEVLADGGDPADRVTLDDQVQMALAVVLDRLTPPERTAFVLHDVFGFPFVSVGQIVGRTPAACRQLASRARRSIRDGSPPVPTEFGVTEQRLLAERFIAACAGGDIGDVMALLDPDVAGVATLEDHGPLVEVTGRPAVAQRLLALFGPGTGSVLVPFSVENHAGVIAFTHGQVRAVMKLETDEGLVHHIESFVRRR